MIDLNINFIIQSNLKMNLSITYVHILILETPTFVTPLLKNY